MKINPSSRFVLCRPQGGINDMLTQIALCCQYGLQFDRTVIVDTAYVWSQSLGNALSLFMISKSPRVHLNLIHTPAELDKFSAFPHSLQGKLTTYRGFWHEPSRCLFDMPDGHGSEISFDFNRDYEEEVIVHHAYGGGEKSVGVSKFIRCHDSLVDSLKARLLNIGGPFAAVHVRYTDMKTDYQSMLDFLEARKFDKVFLATDSAFILDTFKAKLSESNIFTFTRKLSQSNAGLHVQRTPDPEQRFLRTVDAFLDLLTLTFAEVLALPKTVDGQGDGGYSGFGLLAERLRSDPLALQALLSRYDLPYHSVTTLNPP